MSQSPENHELLEQVTKALVDQPVPSGPSPEVTQQLLDKLAHPVTISSVPFWKGNIMRKVLRTAAMILVAAGFVIYISPPPSGGPGAAFAAMLAQVREVRTATFTVLAQLDGTQEVTTRSSLLEPAWMRQEIMMDGKLQAIMIMNQETGKSLTLEPNAKKAIRIDTSGMPSSPSQESIIESFKKLPDDIAIFEGQELIENVETLKYVYDLSGMNYAIWIHPETKMPVKITMADHVDPEQAKFRVTMNDFDWGAEVDESLFSLDLPEGYELQEQSIDLSNGEQHDFVTMLRIFVRLNDDKFPDAWNALTPATMSRLLVLSGEATNEEKKAYATMRMASALDKPDAENLSEEQREALSAEFQQVVVHGAVYFSKLLESNDWHYQGKGISLGEADKIVAWWSLKKEKAKENANLETAQVIYGDLRIEEMPVDQLSKQEE